jgi:hypothetical protein
MATSPKTYTRLTRDAAGLGSYSSLWLGADHLIIVRSSGYHEDYTRLHFGDMKGVFLTETKRRRWWAVGWGAIAGPSAAGLLLNLSSRGMVMAVFSSIFLVIGGVGLLWNHLLGPGCRAYVLTGVQTAELPSVRRMKQARKVVARLAPLVAAIQAPPAAPPVSGPPVEPSSSPPPVPVA